MIALPRQIARADRRARCVRRRRVLALASVLAAVIAISELGWTWPL